MLSITPFLWFDTQAEEAMQFYTSIFPRSKVIAVHRNGDQVMSVTWELEGQRFMGLNAGPHFTFSEAVSFFVSCETQQEVDELWKKLSEGGSTNQCGWLQDRYGLSWQIIPTALGRLMGDPDRAKAARVMNAMLQMKKIEIAGLERAAAG